MAKINVELTGRNTFYAVDIGDKSYTVEQMYQANVDCTETTIMRVDDDREYDVTEEEEKQVLKAIENK